MLRQNKPESVIHKTNANEVKVSTKYKKGTMKKWFHLIGNCRITHTVLSSEEGGYSEYKVHIYSLVCAHSLVTSAECKKNAPTAFISCLMKKYFERLCFSFDR